jgi:hypothetical protein
MLFYCVLLYRNDADDKVYPSESNSNSVRLQAVLQILISQSLLKKESFTIWSKVNAIQKSLENLALTCYEMRQRIVSLVEENWSLKAELTNTVPRSKYQALRTLYDEAETQVKLIADSKQTENPIQQDQLSLSQENTNKPSATIQVWLYLCCWLFQV